MEEIEGLGHLLRLERVLEAQIFQGFAVCVPAVGNRVL